MNLSDNLKRIRKENNLSQEQLADKLGVSRQSVSKWESGLAYPEMDKVLQICKMFGLNVDELLNQDLKQVEENKQSKSNLNKIVDEFLDYINKTINLFSSMSFKNKIKCLIEQIILVSIIFCVLVILGLVVKNIVSSLISFLPESLYYVVYNILINGFYLLFSLIFGISTMLYIFKVRYLDYFVIVDDSEDDVENKIEKKKFFNKRKEEKIIIREPKHSYHGFISVMINFLLKLFKAFVFLLAFCFCIVLICLFDALTLVFLFKNSGLVFIGSLLLIISFIVINLDILIILYNFIINKKNNKSVLFVSFVLSLMIIGVSTGICMIGIKDFNYKSVLNSNKFDVTKYEYDSVDKMFFLYPDEEDYIESDINNVVVEIKHAKNSLVYKYEYEDGQVQLYVNYNVFQFFKLINDIIDDINNKEIIYYDDFEIKIYASKENIKKLKQNKSNYLENIENNYYDEIDDLRKENAELHDKINSLENVITDLNDKIYDLETR